MNKTQVEPKHEVNRKDKTDGGREAESKPIKEQASRNADVGNAPEQGGTSPAGTKKGSRNTM